MQKTKFQKLIAPIGVRFMYTTITIDEKIKSELESWAEEHCSRKDSWNEIMTKLLEKADGKKLGLF